MAGEKKYYIRVPEAVVEVSKEVYRAYHQEARYARTLPSLASCVRNSTAV